MNCRDLSRSDNWCQSSEDELHDLQWDWWRKEEITQIISKHSGQYETWLDTENHIRYLDGEFYCGEWRFWCRKKWLCSIILIVEEKMFSRWGIPARHIRICYTDKVNGNRGWSHMQGFPHVSLWWYSKHWGRLNLTEYKLNRTPNDSL